MIGGCLHNEGKDVEEVGLGAEVVICIEVECETVKGQPFTIQYPIPRSVQWHGYSYDFNVSGIRGKPRL